MKTLLIILFGTIAVACAASEALPTKDVSYVKDGNDYRRSICTLDLKLPTSAGFPTVVWFQGGGLESGNKHFPRLDSRIAIVSVNYRLMKSGNGVQGSDCIHDAAEAVAWTLENIERYGGDPRKVYVRDMRTGSTFHVLES